MMKQGVVAQVVLSEQNLWRQIIMLQCVCCRMWQALW